MVSCRDCIYYKAPGEQAEGLYIGKDVAFCEKLQIKNVWIKRAESCNFFTPRKERKKLEEVKEVKIKKEAKVEEELEKIRGMSKSEIAQTYEISESYASVLRSALKADRYKILKREELSLSEMADKLEISKSTVRSYLSALKQVELL